MFLSKMYINLEFSCLKLQSLNYLVESMLKASKLSAYFNTYKMKLQILALPEASHHFLKWVNQN